MKRIRISRILSLALVVILCIALTVCGGTSDMESDLNTPAISQTDSEQRDDSQKGVGNNAILLSRRAIISKGVGYVMD